MQNVFMTGGAGFLGRAILRWAARESPQTRFTVYSRDEAKHARCRREFPQHRYVLGDVTEGDWLEAAVAGHDTVLHLAAMKYVPEGERHVTEAVRVNVDGTRNVVRAALRQGVERVVGISTDKACEPVNVYGLTKLLQERLFQEAAARGLTRFNSVRYGNVVASTGSVITLFRRQAREGKITLTDPEMTRFWLSVEEAVALVLDALREEVNGTVLIPRLPAARMSTVALAAARVELGKDRAEDVGMAVVGQRGGEKQHESLVGRFEVGQAELRDNFLVRLYPPTVGWQGTPLKTFYVSDRPREWLEVDDLAELIEEAPG